MSRVRPRCAARGLKTLLYFAHLFGFYMPWTRGWKFGFRTVREGNAYFRGFKDGRRRERERLLSDD